MKRAWVLAAIGIVCLLGFSGTAAASADDFRFASFEADYYLGADSEGRSTLKTVERLAAEFPDRDQNHGIERAIPKEYDGHATSLKIQSVTDGNGTALPYTAYGSGANEVLRIGDSDRYVRGTQTYVITYTQRDVTRYFADTARDEFYWDTNGTQWPQSFGRLTARVHVADNLLPTLSGDMACYQGAEGSDARCQIARSGNVITATAENLGPRQNMTLALGFTAGTFRGYEPSLWDRIVAVWTVVVFATSVLAFVLFFWLPYRYVQASNRARELQPVAPEYIPPPGTNVLTAAQIGAGTRAATTAQLIDLAVRHYVTMRQTKEKSLLRQAEYELEIVKPVDSLSDEEQTFVRTLFGSDAVGTTLQTKTLRDNYKATSQLAKNAQALAKRIAGDYGLRAKNEPASRPFKRGAVTLLLFGLLTVSPLLLIAALVAAVCAWQLKPLTDKGLDLRRYLAGLKTYIEYAEKDRIAALQSPEAVAKTGVAVKGDNDRKLIKLYEKTLPYAVLFGQEKQWNEQLALRYEQAGTAPDWYAGHGAFNAAVFAGAMNDFGGSLNSYGASGSSSSGGSSGGGSSGGGGGGGGGGGW